MTLRPECFEWIVCKDGPSSNRQEFETFQHKTSALTIWWVKVFAGRAALSPQRRKRPRRRDGPRNARNSCPMSDVENRNLRSQKKARLQTLVNNFAKKAWFPTFDFRFLRSWNTKWKHVSCDNFREPFQSLEMELMEFNMIKIEDPSHRFSKTVTLEVSGSFYTFVVEGGTRLSLRVPCLSQSRFRVETQMFFQWDVGWPHGGTLKKAQHKDLWLSIASTQTQLLNGWMCECFAWHLWDQWDLILLIATEDKSLEYLILVNPKVLAEFAWKTLWNLPLKFCFDFVDLDDRRIETFHWFTVCRCCMLQEPGVTEVTCPIAAIQDIYSLSEDGSCQAWLGNSLKRLQKCLKV